MSSFFSRICSAIIPPGTREYLLSVRNHFIRPLWHRKAAAHFRNSISRHIPIWLDIGSGAQSGKNGWTTVDICRGCDLRWDLRNPLPFPDWSVARIYTSHFLEHLDDVWLADMLAECRRVLTDGGTLSVCVPNVTPYLKGYANPGSVDVATYFAYIPKGFVLNSPIDHLNYIFYMGGEHRHMFDTEGLLDTLRRAGFNQVRQREFDRDLDLEERRSYSLYAEATK
jgi:predicted SAM-dependent methyltransferase